MAGGGGLKLSRGRATTFGRKKVLGGLPRSRWYAIGDCSKNSVEIVLAHGLGFIEGEGVGHALPMPVDENQRLVALHQHRVELVMGVFDLVRHRRMSGEEGTKKPQHPVGWAQNHILSNPLHRSRRDSANCWADPQFNTVRKINPLLVRCRRSLLRQSPAVSHERLPSICFTACGPRRAVDMTHPGTHLSDVASPWN